MCIGFLNFHNFRKGHYGSLVSSPLTCLLGQHDIMTKMDFLEYFLGRDKGETPHARTPCFCDEYLHRASLGNLQASTLLSRKWFILEEGER